VGRALSLSHKQVSDAKTGVALSAAHRQAISDAKQGVPQLSHVGNGRPVDLTQRRARQGVCHCQCGCGPCDSSKWSCYMKALRNVEAGRTGVDGKGVPYCAPM
jgi:hypothetical protein